MLSRRRCLVYYGWQKLRTDSLHNVTRSGYFSGWVPRTGVTFQTKCNNAATRREIAFCQKWEPLRCRKCPSAIPDTEAAPLHCSVAAGTLYMSLFGLVLIIQLLIYSNGDSPCLVVSYLTQQGCGSWWDCRYRLYLIENAASQHRKCLTKLWSLCCLSHPGGTRDRCYNPEF